MVVMASSKSPLFDTATTLGKIMSFLGVSGLCGVLAAGLIFPLAATGGAAAAAGKDLLDTLPAQMDEEPLSVPSHIYAADGETKLATFYAEDRDPVEFDEISQHMKDAIVAIEDERFYEHDGVDPRGLARAVVNNLTTETQQGASTLTQQYVNNVLINAQNLRGERTTISGTKTYADKLREMKLAVAAEEEMTKEEILQGYLNIVPFGGRVYGVEAAAQHYWGVSASELSLSQAATLAGMVQSPNGYDPADNPDAAKERRDVVLGVMHDDGVISDKLHRQAVQQDLDATHNNRPDGCVAADGAGYFCDYVRRVVLADDTFGPDRDARERLLNRGGLRITTTLDPDLQKEADSTFDDSVPTEDYAEDDITQQVGASLVTVEPGTGNIKAMAQNSEYSAEDDPASNVINWNTDFAYGGSGGFQGGSSLKPYVAAAWVEQGNSMMDRVDASKDHYERGSTWEASCLPGGSFKLDDTNGWSIANAIDAYREMTFDFGLYWSLNTATVAAAKEMDMCAITDVTNRLNIHTARGSEQMNPKEPAFILGGAEIAPLTQAAAYATFANGGEYCRPRAITEVTDAEGNEYEVPEANCEQVIDEKVVNEVNVTLGHIAEDKENDGELDFPAIGKTGTNNNESSTWFIGSTSGLTTASWVGTPEGQYSMGSELAQEDRGGIEINGETHEHVYGSTIAAPQWQQYMGAVADEYETEKFPEPKDSPWEDPGSTARYQGVTADGDGTEPGGSSDDDSSDDSSDDSDSSGDSGGSGDDSGDSGNGGDSDDSDDSDD